MSQLTKQALKVENNTEFPNNNSGFITPSRLRGFNEDMIDSTANQTEYAAFTASISASVNELLLLSASLSGGYVTEGELQAATASLINQINTKVDTTTFNSYTASQSTGSLLTTASFASQTLTFTKADGSTFGIVIPDVSGSTIDTGSFATTGSNTFTGDQTLTDSAGNFFTITDTSGSLMLVAKSFTSASAHLTSSANLTNLIFKTNNNNPSTVISGSGNIFTNGATVTAGQRRYMTSANLALAGALPQISASMGFSPTISGNIITNTFGNPIIVRGPVSSSAYSISSNLILGGGLGLGQSAANHFEQAVNGVSIGNNIFGGTTNLIANRTRLTQVVSINGNQIQGSNTFNMNSSSIDVSLNILYGTNIFTNNSSGSSRVSVGGNAVGLYTNLFIGTNTSTFSGSNDPNDVQDLDYQGGIYRSIIVGTNTPFVQTGPTGSNSINNTGIIGNGLIVTGSSGNSLFGNDTLRHGSLFAGRFNADGTRNRTSENVFVIGTGTSTTNRKTGFLIDSGSNTFIEGTLNVSGASSLNGNLIITGSLTASLQEGYVWVGGSGSVSTTVATSSLQAPALSGKTFYATVSQSGSANVSQSIEFSVTGSGSGISLVSGSQLQVDNAGLYEITLTANWNIDLTMDTVYLWVMKNGVNITNSAQKQVDDASYTIIDQASAGDYYEFVWEGTQGDAVLEFNVASGNRPDAPAAIASIHQIN